MAGQASAVLMSKIGNIEEIRQYGVVNPDPVELRRDEETGRLVTRAYSDAYSGTDIDFWDLVGWLRSGPRDWVIGDESIIVPLGSDFSGHRKGA